MIGVAIEGAHAVIGKEQGYMALTVRRDDFDGTPGLTTAWEPTPIELARLLNGAKVHVSILGLSHPPISLSVGETPREG